MEEVPAAIGCRLSAIGGAMTGAKQNPLLLVEKASRRRRGLAIIPNASRSRCAAADVDRLGHNGGRSRLCARLSVNRVVNFLPMDRNFLGSYDPEPDLIAADLDHGNRDIVVNNDTLVFFSGQY
jgi:hypothetical protein